MDFIAKRWKGLVFLILVVLLLIIAYYQENKGEAAFVSKIIDGDTIEIESGERVRLIGINAPEKNQFCYEEAKDELEKLILNKTVILKKDKENKDRYSRLLRYVYYKNMLVNSYLLEKGLVYYYPYSEEYPDLKKSELIGMRNKGCLWNFSDTGCIEIEKFNYDAEGNDRNNLNDEYITFKNVCNNNLEIKNWKIIDEANHYFTMDINLKTSEKITLHTGKGINNKTDIYWNSNIPVWNNDGDTLYVGDEKNQLVLIKRY